MSLSEMRKPLVFKGDLNLNLKEFELFWKDLNIAGLELFNYSKIVFPWKSQVFSSHIHVSGNASPTSVITNIRQLQ